MSWGYNEETGEFGYWTVWVWDRWLSDATRTPVDTEVTFYRGNPTKILSLEEADPFSDATATLEFPGITGFDQLGVGGTVPWMKTYTNVDVYFLPCTEESWTSFHGLPEQQLLNPMTNSTYLYLHEYGQDGNRIAPVWEGFIWTFDPQPTGTTVQCKGALYQVDEYHAKPLNPLRPKRMEEMIGRYFDPTRRGLWTQALEIDWAGSQFTREYTQWDADRLYAQGGLRFLPTGSEVGPVATQDNDSGLALGTPWTTWLTRNTGNWEKALTGYVQPTLSTMYAMPDGPDYLRPGEPSYGTGITQGDQWTIRKDSGRKPVLYLRRQAKDPNLSVWYGSPGVTVNLTKDASQQYNVVFAQGVGSDGISWNQVTPLGDASFLTWAPLYPEEDENGLYVGWEANNNLQENYDGYYAARERAEGLHVSERFISDFPAGVDEDDARRIAKMWIARDEDSGWMGTISLSIDVFDDLDAAYSRWKVHAGDVIVLKGWQGYTTAEPGVNVFHIARVEKKPMEGTVELTIDTKFRDLLTIEHALATGKDTLSVVYSNRTGQMMNQIQDLAAPWSPNKGSGVMPTTSHKLWTRTERFPYTDFTTTVGNRPLDCFRPAFRGTGTGFDGGSQAVIKMLEHDRDAVAPSTALSLQNAVIRDNPSGTHGTPADLAARGLYVPVQAGAANKSRRWAFFPVLLANAGSIYRTEFACYDVNGNLATNVEFHVSMYSIRVDQGEMPRLDTDALEEYSALWDGAFERLQRNGLPWPDGAANHWNTEAQRIGWGTYDRPCGYSPSVKDFADPNPTGMMVDGGTWDFDMSGNNDWDPNEWEIEENITSAAISWWVAIYAQILGNVETGDEDNSTGSNWVYFRGRVYRSVSIGSGS